ncbi:hypothetical protein E2320_015315, partial [Naja naja]
DLFAPDYTEIHYTKTGTAQTICLNKTDNCFYHGRVRAIHESSVVLSTCRGLRGLIVISNNLSYILEPLPDSQEHHFIYRSEHLKVPHGSCGSEHLESKVTDWLAELTGRTEPRYHRVKRDDQQSMKYVELLLVADYAEFQKNKHDLQATKNKLVEAANYVDKFYRSLNIRIALVGLEVWNDYNKCDISENPHSTLWSFLAWRRKLLIHKKHDNAQLITAPFPRVFNECNRKELERYLQSGGGMCLYNMPDTRTLYGGRRCGNGYLEEGEECDCGEAEECHNPCCNAANCTLKQGAECAHGTCCHKCKLVSPGTLCREQERICDLPEYCSGKSPFCPANFYQMDGTPCEDGRAYCYNGMCLTYEQQCLQLWGYGARSAPDLCFEKVNAAGDSYGNCGKDISGNYRKCDTRNAKCGKIQCQSSASKPLESNAVAIDTTIKLNGREIHCRGTHVYRNEEDEGDILDPGLVMTGTKCGDSHICNNNHNCHCFSGWAPPFCDKPGKGGSMDSGPMLEKSPIPIIIGVLVAILFLTLIGIAFCCYKWGAKLVPVKKTIFAPKKTQQSSTPPSIQKEVNGHANPAFKLKTPQGQRKITDIQNALPKSEVLYCEPPAELKRQGRPPPPAFPANYTKKPPFWNIVLRRSICQNELHQAGLHLYLQTSWFSRLRPPQRALPANPVSSGNRTNRAMRNPGAANPLKFRS